MTFGDEEINTRNTIEIIAMKILPRRLLLGKRLKKYVYE